MLASTNLLIAMVLFLTKERFRYAPQFEKGGAVAVNDIKTRTTFHLDN